MKKSPEKRLTRGASQTEVVTLATYLLGGAQKAVDTEDIAVEAHRLAPGRFSWKKYPDQINLELIRVYLSDAKKSDKGELLLGSGRTGWRLTQRGLKWAQQAAQNIKHIQTTRTRAQLRSGSIDEQRWRRERSRIQATQAWKMWAQGERDIPQADAKAIFRIDSYAKGDLLEAKITRVRSLFLEDEEVGPFIDHLIANLTKEGAT
jgi:hypothetical protein